MSNQRWRLRQALLNHAPQLLRDWFPNGTVQGHTFCVGSLAGEPGDSLKVSLRTGGWRDWNGRESWIDLISLYAAKESLTYGEAERQLAFELRAELTERADLEPVEPVR